MAKQQVPKSKTDTTKIPTPYKVAIRKTDAKGNLKSGGEVGAVGSTNRKMADSTKAKMNYNTNVVGKAVEKRNVERLSEGKKPIPKSIVFGTKNNAVESTKGKTFKQAPLPLPKKK